MSYELQVAGPPKKKKNSSPKAVRFRTLLYRIEGNCFWTLPVVPTIERITYFGYFGFQENELNQLLAPTCTTVEAPVYV